MAPQMNELIRTLPYLLRVAGESHEIAEAVASAAWRRASGEGLQAHAVAFRLYGKTLIIAVQDATWQRQLEAMSGQLLFRLNSLMGQALVTYLEFRIDPGTVSARRRGMPPPEINPVEQERRAFRNVDTALASAAGAIHDDALRHRFLMAAGSCINRREGEGR